MYTTTTQVRVRYSETDQMGYVYYGHYATFYEVGRTSSIKSIGISYKSLEEQGIMLPVAKMEIKYMAPAKYDDLLTITTSVTRMPSKAIEFYYEIHNEEGQLLNKATTTLFFVDHVTRRPVMAPQPILDALKPYFD